MPFDLKDVKIGFAKEENFDEIIKLLTEITTSIQHKDGWSNYRVSTTSVNQRTIYLKALAENKIFIAVYKEKIIGLINLQLVLNLRHGWERAHLEEVVVHSDFRKKKVGSLLIEAVKDYCHQQGIKVIKLMCGEQLLDSQAFYQRNGFVCKDKGFRCEL